MKIDNITLAIMDMIETGTWNRIQERGPEDYNRCLREAIRDFLNKINEMEKSDKKTYEDMLKKLKEKNEEEKKIYQQILNSLNADNKEKQQISDSLENEEYELDIY